MTATTVGYGDVYIEEARRAIDLKQMAQDSRPFAVVHVGVPWLVGFCMLDVGAR